MIHKTAKFLGLITIYAFDFNFLIFIFIDHHLGRPHRAKILSSNLGFKKDQYNLTWTVDSFLPIEEYRILYRVNLVSII